MNSREKKYVGKEINEERKKKKNKKTVTMTVT